MAVIPLFFCAKFATATKKLTTIVSNKERTDAFPDIPIQSYRGMFSLQAEYDETTRRPHQNQFGFDAAFFVCARFSFQL